MPAFQSRIGLEDHVLQRHRSSDPTRKEPAWQLRSQPQPQRKMVKTLQCKVKKTKRMDRGRNDTATATASAMAKWLAAMVTTVRENGSIWIVWG